MKFGWIPDLPDHRDYYYAAGREEELPDVVDTRPGQKPIFDQDECGSCSGNAVSRLTAYIDPDHFKDSIPSRMGLYYRGRECIGTINEDSGACIRDVIWSMNYYGVCRETLWKYDIAHFRDPPTPEAVADAALHKSVEYRRVPQTEYELRHCLTHWNPFVFGATIYESFNWIKKDGMVNMPSRNEKRLGGHAMCCVGFHHPLKRFIVANSWGEKWGDHGYCYFPYEYLVYEDLCADFWTLSKMT